MCQYYSEFSQLFDQAVSLFFLEYSHSLLPITQSIISCKYSYYSSYGSLVYFLSLINRHKSIMNKISRLESEIHMLDVSAARIKLLDYCRLPVDTPFTTKYQRLYR